MIIDAFTFFNELDILEIRLRELYDVVDRFVLVEATHTHKGDTKPLSYATNRQRFAQWNDKIVHIVVGDLPAGDTQAAIWRREIGQRQAIERGLRDVPDDVVALISDLDEIPRMEAVRALQGGIPDDMVIVFDQTLYYYNVNTSCTNLRWSGTRATMAGNVRALTPDGIRWSGLRSHEYPRVARLTGDSIGMPDRSAGWHLSYFGDAAHIQAKMRAFLHQELVNDENLDPDTIARRMSEGLDIWGRESEQQFIQGAAPDLPRAIRSDPVRWAQYFHPDYRPVFHEDWYPSEQALIVGDWARAAPEGAIVEIGCWEGKSSACIAQAIAPRKLIAIDHWQGNGEEEQAKNEPHPSVQAAGERNVYSAFKRNMNMLVPGNVDWRRMDWHIWLCGHAPVSYHAERDGPIAFLHLDASHDYGSVYECLTAIKPFLVEGAIVCGDDLYADGVYRGVHDALGEGVQDVGGRLWVWQKGIE